MLGKSNAYATIAVKDLDAAKKFYEGTLGLEQENRKSWWRNVQIR